MGKKLVHGSMAYDQLSYIQRIEDRLLSLCSYIDQWALLCALPCDETSIGSPLGAKCFLDWIIFLSYSWHTPVGDTFQWILCDGPGHLESLTGEDIVNTDELLGAFPPAMPARQYHKWMFLIEYFDWLCWSMMSPSNLLILCWWCILADQGFGWGKNIYDHPNCTGSKRHGLVPIKFVQKRVTCRSQHHCFPAMTSSTLDAVSPVASPTPSPKRVDPARVALVKEKLMLWMIH